MRVINDSDTTTYTDAGGDTLTLLDCPRQRDLEKSEKLEREDAFAQLDDLKRIGIDTEKALSETTPEQMDKAKEDAKGQALSLDVRRFRLEAVARSMNIGGQVFGGQAILDQYDRMDAASVAWVDAQVATVWSKGQPGDAEREG